MASSPAACLFIIHKLFVDIFRFYSANFPNAKTNEKKKENAMENLCYGQAAAPAAPSCCCNCNCIFNCISVYICVFISCLALVTLVYVDPSS